MKPIIPVMFRAWRNGGVFALFPTVPGTYAPHTCAIYEHVGQHGSAAVASCIAASRPARPDEYAALLRELRGIYDDCELRIVLRESPKMRAERYAELNQMKGAVS